MPKTKARGKAKYIQIKIPKDLIQEVDEILGKHGFRSRQEFVRDAVRRLLNVYGVPPREENKRQ